MPRPDQPLRVAWLVYRGNPHCGGQGVYTREPARELTAARPPRSRCSRASRTRSSTTPSSSTKLPSLDLYRPRTRSGCRGRGSSRPRSTSRSSPSCARRASPSRTRSACGSGGCSSARRADFDLVHDNQCLGSGLLGDDGRRLAGARHAAPPDHRRPRPRPRRTPQRRGSASPCVAGTAFLEMQMKVARDPALVDRPENRAGATSSPQMGVDAGPPAHRARRRRPGVFRPLPEVARVPGRLMTTASADVPMKGLVPPARGAWPRCAPSATTPSSCHRQAQGQEQDPGAHRPARARRRRAVRVRRDRPSASSSSTPRPRWRSCRRSTRASRSPRSRRWRAACRSSPPPAARSPRSSAPTARPACWCRRATPTRWRRDRCAALGDAELRARIGAAGRDAGRSTSFTWRQTAESARSRTTAPCSTTRRACAGRGLMLTVDFDRLDLRDRATGCSTWAAAAVVTRSQAMRRGATVVALDYDDAELKDVRAVVAR